jgi:hypothetical protein
MRRRAHVGSWGFRARRQVADQPSVTITRSKAFGTIDGRVV